MLHVLDIRDALEGERFLQYQFESVTSSSLNALAANANAKAESDQPEGTIATVPPPVLSPTMWTESNASTFKVRGGSYNAGWLTIFLFPSVSLGKSYGLDV